MGQQNNTSMPMETNDDLVITYDKPFYHPGSQVNGNIYLYVRSPCQISHLMMNIKGSKKPKQLTVGYQDILIITIKLNAPI